MQLRACITGGILKDSAKIPLLKALYLSHWLCHCLVILPAELFNKEIHCLLNGLKAPVAEWSVVRGKAVVVCEYQVGHHIAHIIAHRRIGSEFTVKYLC